jgi:imidazolonepropionase
LLTLRGPPGPRRGADLSDLGIIKQGAVLIANDKIRHVGLTSRLANLKEADNATEINASGCVVLPGFVDSHTHLVGLPTRFPETPDQPGILDQKMIRAESSSPMLLANSNRILKDCVRHGTTTLEAKSGHGWGESGEIRILKTHAALQLISTFMAGAPSEHSRRDQHLDWLCDSMLPLVAAKRLAEFVDIECEDTAFSVDQSRRFLLAARQLGFALKMHVGQFSDIGAVRLGLELGVVSLDHLVHVNTADFYNLAGSDIVATLLPASVFYRAAEPYAPARALIDRGIAVALATNYNLDTSPSQSMLMTISLACRSMSMTAAEAISAATINGAWALRRAGRIGSLEIGKDADLIILGVPDYREIPLHFGVNLVQTTIKRGRVLFNLDATSATND